MRKIATLLVGVAAALSVSGVALTAQAAGLTDTQVNAVISLLQSFGVDQTTLLSVEAALNGTASTGTGTTTPAPTPPPAPMPADSCYIGILRVGDQGDAVRCLQQLLASDPSIYPQGLITGYFGEKTRLALMKYQMKHGLAQVGFIGPQTLKLLLVDWNNKHGKGDGNHGTTTPSSGDHTAPVLSAVATGNISANAATITWITDENATSKVEYGTTTAYGSTASPNSWLVTTHTVNLTGLTASTLYHFHVLSTDAYGNKSVSSDMTFTTAAAPDTTAPTLSGVSVGSIASTSATVSWTTSENADSKVYYSTTSPLVLGTALLVNDTSLLTSHSQNLTSLTASTTYYYVVTSTDAAANTATSSEASFTTTN